MIGAILVLYNPNIDILSKALKSLTSQVNEICIVDNSENSNEKLLENFTNIHYIPLYKNTITHLTSSLMINTDVVPIYL